MPRNPFHIENLLLLSDQELRTRLRNPRIAPLEWSAVAAVLDHREREREHLASGAFSAA